MAKITYYLGAGASYYSCPILEKQAKMMINLAKFELLKVSKTDQIPNYKFTEDEKSSLPNDNKIKILWHIGYYGKKALKFNTIDTYARKLALSGSSSELNLLKMSVSVFFDLWENFYEEEFYSFYLDSSNKTSYKNIDYRYTSLFSILLDRPGTKLKINDSFKFITWNYDLQLESTFKSFMRQNEVTNFSDLDKHYFAFKENHDLNIDNDVFHLNGHRGFFVDKSNNNRPSYELKQIHSYDSYWEYTDWLFNAALYDNASFHQYIKYAWEQDLNSNWFKKIAKVLNETDVLVIVGYSFPPFNREIDQFLFSNLDSKKIKKIVYQDPNASKQIIKNLFKSPQQYENKIFIETENLNQFHIPNEHFNSQDIISFRMV